MINNKPAFFVYIVESPSAPDLYHRRTEGDVISRGLNLSEIPCVSRCAISKEAFQAALQIGLKDEMGRFTDSVPILHISSHGHSNGIQMSSGEVIEWEELSRLLSPINTALADRLIVAMSCCKGYAGIRMAMKLDDSPMPFYALVGSAGSPTWSDTAVAFSSFYHRLSKGAHIADAVKAMNEASGCNEFFLEWAEFSKKGYLDYIKNLNPSVAQQQLEDIVNAQPPNNLAKLVRLEGES